MIKAYRTFLGKSGITRIVCMLLLVFAVFSLTGCDSESSESTDQAVTYEKAMKGCLICSLFESIYDAVTAVSEKVVPSVAEGMLSILGIAYGLWLAMFVMKNVSSFAEPDSGAFWKNLTAQTFWVIVGAALLTAMKNKDPNDSLLFMFAKPVFSGFTDAGLTIIQATGGNLSCAPGSDAKTGLVCLIKALQDKLWIAPGLAFLAIFVVQDIVIKAFVLFFAVLLVIVSLMMMVYLPIQLLHSVFRYGIALCMLPVATVAYVFKQTRNFTSKVAQMYMEIGFAILGMCVFASSCVQVLQEYIDTFLPFIKDPLVFLHDPDALANVIFGPGIIGLVFLCFFLICFGEVILDFMFVLTNAGIGGMGAANPVRQVGNTVRNITHKVAGSAKALGEMRDNKTLNEAKAAGGLEEKMKQIKEQNGGGEKGEKAAKKFEMKHAMAQERQSLRGDDGKK